MSDDNDNCVRLSIKYLHVFCEVRNHLLYGDPLSAESQRQFCDLIDLEVSRPGQTDIKRPRVVHKRWIGPERGQIYFAVFDDMEKVKIGFSVNPDARRQALQTGNAEKIKILGTVAGTVQDERALHKRFSCFRLSGEWFKFSDEIKAYIESVVSDT